MLCSGVIFLKFSCFRLFIFPESEESCVALFMKNDSHYLFSSLLFFLFSLENLIRYIELSLSFIFLQIFVLPVLHSG